MVKKTLLSMVVVTFLLAAPRPAIAGCIKEFQDCALAAARMDSVWYAWLAYCDCELDYLECLRIAVIGF
jgi:hypothetical protein